MPSHLQDNFGIPQPQRSLAQIQEHARQLRQNAGGISSLSERRAAAGLLGASLDTAALTKKTVDFSVAPSREDAFPEDTWTVEDYMSNMARRNVAVTIQTRLNEEALHVEGFMTQCMDAAWAAERQAVLDTVMAPAWGTSSSPHGAARSPQSSPYRRSPAPFTALTPASPGAHSLALAVLLASARVAALCAKENSRSCDLGTLQNARSDRDGGRSSKPRSQR